MAADLPIIAWRDHDERVNAAVPGMSLGPVALTGPVPAAVSRLVATGARRVRLIDPVDARLPVAVSPLLLIRELTRYGVVVDWSLVLDPIQHDWRELSHLYPPSALTGVPDVPAVLVRWRREFFPGKFIVRRGPGFIQVRDRRWNRPRFVTLAAYWQVDLVHRLLVDALDVADVGEHLGELEDLRIALRVADQWWMPAYQIWRWPMPAEFV